MRSQIVILALAALFCAAQAQKATTTMTALVTATDTVTNSTYALYGYSNASSVIDNRQIWESAAYACEISGGVLANVTASNIAFIGNMFTWYTSNISGATTAGQWGNRRVCAWVGVTNLGSTKYAPFFGNFTTELFWAEDNGAECGAICDGGYPSLYARDCDYEPQAFICQTTAAVKDTPVAPNYYAPPLPPPVYPGGYPVPPAPLPPSPFPPPYPSPPPLVGNYPPVPPSPSPNSPLAKAFTKCVTNYTFGTQYCAVTSGVDSALPFAWADAAKICQTANSSWSGNLVAIGSTDELNFLMSAFPLTNSTVGYWTAGIFTNLTTATVTKALPAYAFGGTSEINAFLQSTTIAAASSSSNWLPTWAYGDQGLNGTTYTGNFINGYGGAVGLTWTSKGLEYVDAGFPLGVLCELFVGYLPPSPPVWPPKSPLPTNNDAPTAASTPRADGANYTYFPVAATLYMSAEGCANAEKYPKPFNYMYQDSTALAWNTTQTNNKGTAYILAGDVTVLSNVPSCSSTGRRLAESSSATRRMLADAKAASGTSSGPNVAMTANVNLPNGYSATQAAALQSAFASACVSAYTSGQFASNYGITGASVTVSDPKTAIYSVGGSSNALALGLGIGLGVGIPVLAAAIFGIYYLMKKRGDQEVAPQ